jgi:oligopeptide transport system permease protein
VIFLAKRSLQMGLSLWLLATLTFFMMKVFPGSPFDDEISLHPSVQKQVEAQYGLNEPIQTQYLVFLKGLVHGNFGVSQFFVGKEAREVIVRTFPTTLKISSLALGLAMISALFLALVAHIGARGYVIYETITLILLSTPLLLAGPLLIYLLGFRLNFLPVALLESPASYVLPVFAVAMRPTASLARLLYTALQDNQQSDYLRTAKAMGHSELRILLKMNMRNSLIPVLAYLGPLAALLLTGSTMVEIVFAIPGLGSQFVEAVLNRDSSMVIGLTIFYGFFILFFQLIVDLGMAWLDPRLRKS